jgi:hypothetical protein
MTIARVWILDQSIMKGVHRERILAHLYEQVKTKNPSKCLGAATEVTDQKPSFGNLVEQRLDTGMNTLISWKLRWARAWWSNTDINCNGSLLASKLGSLNSDLERRAIINSMIIVYNN